MTSLSLCDSKSYRGNDLARLVGERIRRSIRCWYLHWHTRGQLLALDDRALSDIGISRQQALDEAHKPFWRS